MLWLDYLLKLREKSKNMLNEHAVEEKKDENDEVIGYTIVRKYNATETDIKETGNEM